MRGRPSQQARLGAAVVVVAATVFAAPVIDALVFPEEGASGAVLPVAGVQSALRSGEVLNVSDIDEALGHLERIVAQDEAEAPDWLLAEAGPLPDARDMRVDRAEKVVGYVVDCDVEAALSNLEKHMEALGWTAVSLGQADGFTFVKPSGRCTWALATCTQVGAATSVVMRLV